MDDMIYRQAAMERLMAQNVIMDGSEYHNGFNAGVNRAQEVIRNLPPVQSDHNAEVSKMEIVRCKDCKYWIPYDWMFSEVWQSQNMADYPEDEIGCNYCDMAMKANDFCSMAEKRGDSE